MLRSLYSGISGMSVNQTKMDVIGNNISNVGTTSFKSGRVRFQDMLRQNVNQAMAPSVNQGGTNAKQVGLGVQVAGIDTLTSQGMMQPTSRNLDAAIDGQGYFMVGKGATPNTNATGITQNSDHSIGNTNGMNVMYSRDGSFSLDSQGNLVTSDGYRVLGYPVQDSVDYTNGALNSVNFVDADTPGLKADSTLVPLVIPDKVSTPAYAATMTTNVNIPNPIPTAGNLDITVDGTSQSIAIATTDTLATIITKINTAFTPATIASASGNKLQLTSPTTGAAASSVTIAGTSNAAVTSELGLTVSTNVGQDPSSLRISSFSIEKDGVIKAVLEDGSVSVLGQIAMASFRNPEGLTSLGKNLFLNSPNSGSPAVRSGYGSASDNSKGYGDMLQGMLEMSNVDLASQFTDMIVTSRAFQASAKVITTGDQILQDILNLKQ